MAAASPGSSGSNKSQETLRFGDTVMLYAKGERKGYLFSELTSTKYNICAVSDSRSLEPFTLPNVHSATFKVIPMAKYKMQEDYQAMKLMQKESYIGEHLGNKIDILKQHAENEQKENEAEEKRLRWTKIYYGTRIQLVHTLMGHYLAVNSTHTSWTENTSLKVELQPMASSNAIFKILPHYKVRSVGDQVRFNDQIKLESLETDGQFLHCSKRHLSESGFTVLGSSYELNLSATATALIIIPHHRPQIEHTLKTLRGGSVVRMFHCEYECYIVAEGSFANDKQPVVEDVHCRRRRCDHGILKDSSTSANTYWQFEKESDPRSGEPLSWGERCRIKHMPTRRYLTVTKSSTGVHEVTLKESTVATPETVFVLTPITDESGWIHTENYARVQHLTSHTWLHLAREREYDRCTESEKKESNLSAIMWDDAELYPLVVTDSESYHDAFALEQVSEGLLKTFHHVAGIVPVLKDHILESLPFTTTPTTDHNTYHTQRLYRVKEALLELASYLDPTKTGAREAKNRQKLLRNLRILELLTEILSSYQPQISSPRQREVCQTCYEVIDKYLEGDSRKNENYLARHIEFFQKQVRMGLNAEKVMIQMVEDNLVTVSYMATEEKIDFIVEQLLESQPRDPRFLEFLGNLCVCSGLAKPSTQNLIMDKLVHKYGDDVLYRTAVGGSESHPHGDKGVVYFCEPGKNWEELSDITCAIKDVDVKLTCSRCNFFKAQLQLLAKLCKGNNKHTILALTLPDMSDEYCYVTFEEAIQAAKDPKLSPDIRARYVELIIVLYVDVSDNHDALENPTLSFVYDEITETPYASTGDQPCVALTGCQNEHFPQFQTWILEHLQDYLANWQSRSKNLLTAENNLLTSVLEVLRLLVKFGYYDSYEDMDAIRSSLTMLLDPDCVETSSEECDFSRVKEKAMEIVDLFFNFHFYGCLQRFIFDYRILCHKAQYTKPSDEPHEHLQILCSSNSCPDEALIRNARERLCKLFNHKHFYKALSHSGEPEPFPQIMLKNAQISDDLVQTSLYLLSRYYSFEVTLFDRALQSQLLITDESKAVYVEVRDSLQSLRRYISVDIRDSPQAEIIAILQRFTQMCICNEVRREPHAQNQRILYSFGVVSDILDFMVSAKVVASLAGSMNTDQNSEQQRFSRVNSAKKKLTRRQGSRLLLTRPMYSQKDLNMPVQTREIFVECFRFLRAMACNNTEVKHRLHSRMGDLLKINIAVAYMAEVLTEVFTGGPEICLKIKEEQIQQIIQFIALGDSYEGRSELFTTLQTMAKVEELDLPVKRNQVTIVKYISQMRDIFDSILGIESEKVTFRWTILREEADDQDVKLQLLLDVTDLLATCAEGDSPFIESLCQTIFSAEELLNILSCSDLSIDRKKPFARFLVWVYMESDENTTYGVSQLLQSENMWMYLEHLGNELLPNVSKALGEIKSELDRDVIRRVLTGTASRPVGSARSDLRPRSFSCNIPHITDAEGNLLPGVPEYIMRGVVPMLKSFYSAFFSPIQGSHHELQQYRHHIAVSAKICLSLLKLGEVLCPYFTTKHQLHKYCNVVRAITSRAEIHDCLSEDDMQMVRHFELNLELQASFSKERAEYVRIHETEERCNLEFNEFIRNYRRAYQGLNTTSHQLDRSLGFKEAYNGESPTSDDKESSTPGSDDLPLGPRFQELVKCFVDSRETHYLVKKEASRLLVQLDLSCSQSRQLDEAEIRKQDNLDICCLQILRAVLHNQRKIINPHLKPEDLWSCYRERLHPLQNAIQQLGPKRNALRLVIPLLSHLNEIISCEVLAFMNELLYSGNREVQKGLCYLLSTREEGLFAALQKKLEQASLFYKEKYELETQLEWRRIANASYDSKPRPSKSSLRAHSSSMRWRGITPLRHQVDTEITTDVTDGLKEEEIGRDTKDFIDQTAQLIPPMPHRLSIRRRSVSANPQPPASHRISNHGSQPSLQSPSSARRSSTELADLEMQATELPVRNSIHQASTVESFTLKSKSGSSSSKLQLEETSHISLTLKVLGLICDGQYSVMQNYLRSQNTNIKTVNIVREVGQLLQSLLQCNQLSTIQGVDCICQTLQTLIEFCVGNHSNQLVVYDQQVVDQINILLQERELLHMFDLEMLVRLRSKAIELLLTIIEDTSLDMSEITNGLISTLNFKAAHETLWLFYKCHDLHRGDVAEEANRGLFQTYHMLVHLADYHPEAAECYIVPGKSSPFNEAWNFCKERSKSIEVFYKNQDGVRILTRVHFKFQKKSELRHEVKEKVKWKVKRDTPEDKLRDFLQWIISIKKDSEHHTNLKKRWWSRIITAIPDYRYKALLFLTLLLNLVMLFTFVIPEEIQCRSSGKVCADLEAHNGTSFIFRPLYPSWYKYVLYILGSIHLLLALWMNVNYFVINKPNFVIPRFLYKLWSSGQEQKRTYSSTRLLGFMTLYNLMFLLVSFVALFTNGYFYCVCLMHVVVNNDILKRVLKSISKPGLTLLWVFALGFIILYVYAVISFIFLHTSFEVTPEMPLFCDSLLQCFVSVIRYGLLDNLGLQVPLRPTEFRVAVFRLLYDVSFFIIIPIIGLNLVLGITVDTFSELREERISIEQDKKSVCFICSFPNYLFEHSAKGFEDHIKHDHNMWNYIYFSLHLDQIDVRDHNAIEKYVHEMIKDNCIDFFPLRAARLLTTAEDEQSQQMKKLVEKVDTILQRFEDEDRERAKRNRRIELNKWRSWSLSRPPTIDEEEGEEEEEDGGAHP